jgi:hypothetical protein
MEMVNSHAQGGIAQMMKTNLFNSYENKMRRNGISEDLKTQAVEIYISFLF